MKALLAGAAAALLFGAQCAAADLFDERDVSITELPPAVGLPSEPVGEVEGADEALNRAISDLNAAAQAREEAARSRYEAGLADYEAQQKAYREAIAAAEAEAERRRAQYEADRAAWQAQVARCRAGDRSACAQP